MKNKIKKQWVLPKSYLQDIPHSQIFFGATYALYEGV